MQSDSFIPAVLCCRGYMQHIRIAKANAGVVLFWFIFKILFVWVLCVSVYVSWVYDSRMCVGGHFCLIANIWRDASMHNDCPISFKKQCCHFTEIVFCNKNVLVITFKLDFQTINFY